MYSESGAGGFVIWPGMPFVALRGARRALRVWVWPAALPYSGGSREKFCDNASELERREPQHECSEKGGRVAYLWCFMSGGSRVTFSSLSAIGTRRSR